MDHLKNHQPSATWGRREGVILQMITAFYNQMRVVIRLKHSSELRKSLSAHLRGLEEVLQLPVDVGLDGALAHAEVPQDVEGEASRLPPHSVLRVSDACRR